MGDPMRIRAQVKDGLTDVRVLMSHPMETGLRKDSAGKIIPAHYINDVKASSGGKTVMTAKWGQAISQNPYLQFRFKGAKAGDKVSVTWTDNTGDTRTDEVAIA
ncbi:thiosulfate oxidation carrier complex protein SoxZ [Rhizobacter sp. Root404]|uniref:thiosulfate oxidation carrier complex protein SoxZ n=1 Tax=Rhizobacter sp. Root404 TaxID=1736528 RepID=UPI0006F65FF1|nr:thiosulfate oxidation carrier complex protein SoxZ [Rhizobacter sp. Root404]KQW36466.1 thiosulfate oxidation carrier complex protein SoxZ [Rhizobacter sp. Root404]